MPNIQVPGLRRIFPTMVPEDKVEIPIMGVLSDEISKWGFLSRKRIKRRICQWRPSRNLVRINKVFFKNGSPEKYTTKTFNVSSENGMGDFMVALANLSDIHGIIRLRMGEIWMRQVNDSNELNVDSRVVDRIVQRIQSAS